MWLFTREGFYSVVEKPEDRSAGLLTVRTRARDDLVRLCTRLGHAPGHAIVHTPAGDYPYRARLPREAVARWAAQAVLELDYSNFKDTQTPQRHAIYLRVWSALFALEGLRRRGRKRGRRGRSRGQQQAWSWYDTGAWV